MIIPREHLRLSLKVTGAVLLGIFLLPFVVGFGGIGLIWLTMMLENHTAKGLLIIGIIVSIPCLCIWRRIKAKHQRVNL